MRTAIIWHCVYPWDIRIEKVLTLLGRHGHKVNLICRGRKGLPAVEETTQGKIYRVFPSTVGSFLSRLLSYPLFINPFWIYRIVRALIQDKADLILVRDLPLALLAGVIGKVLRIPVVFDMAENYPAALIAYSKACYKPFLFMNGILPRAYERWSLKFINHVFVVAEEQKARLKRLGIPGEKISSVHNTPELKIFLKNAEEGVEGSINIHREATLLYVGKIDRHRGVDILVRAMPEILRRYPETRLQIIGNGTEQKRLMDVVKEMGLEAYVVFEGWVPFRLVPTYIKKSTICLIPHLRSEHTNTTIPNKIFDYMAIGKPVLASDCEPLKRIVLGEECGLIFRSGDSCDLSRNVIQLLGDPRRDTYGLNGKKAVESKYNWEVDSQAMMDAIHNIYAG